MAAINSLQVVITWLPLLIQGALTSLSLAVSAGGIGFILGLGMGIISCKRLTITGITHAVKAYVVLIQGTPVFVQILLYYYALPDLLGLNLSPFAAGAIALGLNSAAYISEIIRGGINAVPSGQWEAAYSLGCSPSITLTTIILPQATSIILPALTNELAVLIKETAVVSVIGVVELTKVGMNLNAQALDPLKIYGIIAVLYLIMTMAVRTLATSYQQKETSHD